MLKDIPYYRLPSCQIDVHLSLLHNILILSLYPKAYHATFEMRKTRYPHLLYHEYLQPIITQYFIDNKSEIWLLFLIAHSKR